MGSHLCDALLAAGHTVRIFDRPNLRHYRVFGKHERIRWIEGDFLNADNVTKALAGCDTVFHLVSTTLPRSSNENPAYDVDSNLATTIRMLDAASRAGVGKIVFASSGGTVYGVPQSTPISESHPTDPICSYGICKLAIEKYLHLYHREHGLDYCVLRLSNPFGERQRIAAAQGAVSVFLHKVLYGETIEIWGDGSVVRDYFHVGDAAKAFILAASYQGAPQVINIGSGQGRSLNDILATIETAVRRPVARKYLPARAFDVPINVLDITRARESLGWQPMVSFEDGIAQTLASMKAQSG